MIPRINLFSWTIPFLLASTVWAYAEETEPSKVETLARHETVAEFRGTNYHRCMGLTSLCPDRCGESGTLATFKIVSYLNYEKLGEYGDPKCGEFAFLVENNMKHTKVPADTLAAINSLKAGDFVLLSWKHDYVTSQGGSSPERPITRLEKIAPVGTQEWLSQIDHRAGVRDSNAQSPTIGSAEWMQAVSVSMGGL